MQETPLVSVICLCYNHDRFVSECLKSVFNQQYQNIEVIVVDDASVDSSVAVINGLKPFYDFTFLINETNLGNCKSFNQALSLVKGKYIIDLATDDVLLPERIARQVAFFEKQNHKCGVVYSNAQIINERGTPLGLESNQLLPSGDLYEQLIQRFIVRAPTMMMKRQVLAELQGYDESLAYEDFDFWIRSSRHYHYAYQNEVLTKIRRVRGSHSDNQLLKYSRQVESTYRVCEKIELLNRSVAEEKALDVRLRYEFKQAVLFGHWKVSKLYLEKIRSRKVRLSCFERVIILGILNLKIDLARIMHWRKRLFRY